MNNKAAYLLSDVTFGIILLSACKTLNSNNTSDESAW